MMTIISHQFGPDFPDTGGTCCMGAAQYGPDRCTCWQPVYDLEQAPEPDQEAVRALAAGVVPNTRAGMCPDCAYRPGSPEKTGEAGYAGDTDALERLAAKGDRFFCHQGIRRVVAWRHPSGVEIPGHPGSYEPPIIHDVPYQADGTPAELCAGWDARRRAVAAQEHQP